MTRFLVQRLLHAAVLLAAMSFVVYGLIGLMPGDPIDVMIASNPELTPADGARLKALYGLDRPLLERYAAWAAAALQGDFGYSRVHRVPVPDILLPRLANTLLLLGTALVIALAIAIPAGVLAAARAGGPVDAGIGLLSFAGISMPPFWLAILLIILFAVQLGWLPAGGMSTVGGGGLADRLVHLALPTMTLVLVSAGGYVRYVRGAMIEELRQDYMLTALAKGLPRGTAIRRHALRNALLPVVTVAALDFGGLFSGALVTETMFGWLGMGKLIYDSVLGNDYNLALVGLLFATLATIVGNLLADGAYLVLDPRITFAGGDR
jgi:peptide/nickel transport system permease protein